MLLELGQIACQRGNGETGLRLEIPALSVQPGEAVAITGPSGCGKSTLLDIIGLVLRPAEAGRFRFGGVDMAALWNRNDRNGLARMRARSIGYVLQTGGLLPFLSVRDNIQLSRDLLGLPRNADETDRLVEALGLARLMDKRPGALSIGERQRVAIARALAHRPALVLADEPTASLDPMHAEAVMQLLLALIGELGLSVLVVSHDWQLMARFGLRRIDARLSTGPAGPITRFAAEGDGLE